MVPVAPLPLKVKIAVEPAVGKDCTNMVSPIDIVLNKLYTKSEVLLNWNLDVVDGLELKVLAEVLGLN